MATAKIVEKYKKLRGGKGGQAKKAFFTCIQCSLKFKCKNEQLDHFEEHHEVKKCDMCEFRTKGNLLGHKVIRHNCCYECQEPFRSAAALSKHQKSCGPIPFRYRVGSCGLCSHKGVNSSLDSHRKQVHEKNYKFFCQFCSYKSITLQEQKVHSRGRISDGSTAKKCDQCDFLSCTNNLLYRHKNRHHHENRGKNGEKEPHLAAGPKKSKSPEEPEEEAIEANEPKKAILESKTLTSSKRPIRFFCQFCNYISMTQREQNLHSKWRVRDGSSVKKCDQCDFASCTFKLLYTHKTIHHKNGQKGPKIVSVLKIKKMPGEPVLDENMPKISILESKPTVSSDTSFHFFCQFCNYESTTPEEQKLHSNERISDGSSVKKCDQCDFLACTNDLLRSHKNLHHQNEQEECEDNEMPVLEKEVVDDDDDISKITISDTKTLTTSGKNYRFFCKFCNYKTITQQELNTHIKARVKHGSSAKKCDQCDFLSCTFNLLFRHKTGHRKDAERQPRVEKAPIEEEKAEEDEEVPKMPMLGSTTLISSVQRQIFMCDFCHYYTPLQQNFKRHVRLSEQKRGLPKEKCVKCGYTSCTKFRVHKCSRYEEIKDKVFHVLPRPKSGVWIVKLERLDD